MAALKKVGRGLWSFLKSPFFRRFLVENILLPMIIKQTGKITDKDLRNLERARKKLRKVK
jgi:hypothetical protein